MSESTPDAPPGAILPGARSTAAVPHPRTVDRMLQLLLLAAERDVRVGLTVNVGGVLVTGNLVGTVSYCRAVADQFATAAGGTGMDETFAEAFRGFVDDAYGIAHREPLDPADGVAAEPRVDFVHLEDARYLTATGLLPITRRGLLWCCRAEDVTAWSLGDLTHG